MKKKICFFSAGFAFNRLNRMRFYENALPKDVEIFLFTTDRWHKDKKKNYQFEWSGLKRTKIFTAKYGLTLPLQLRKFCKDNKIDRIVNIGNRGSMMLFLPATLFSRTEYIFNLMGWVPLEKEMFRNLSKREIKDYLYFYFYSFFAKKVTPNDYGVYKIFTGKNRPWFYKVFDKEFSFLPPPVDVDSFKPQDKKKSRKKLGIPLNKKVIIFVGRVKHRKGSDVLKELIKKKKDVTFIVIGKSEDKEFDKLKDESKNVIYFSNRIPEELHTYYSASDIGLLFQRIRGSGLGQTAHEALACGLPTFAPDVLLREKCPAIYQIPHKQVNNGDFVYDTGYATREAEKIIDNHFKKNVKEKAKLSKIARDYVVRNFSYEAWKKPHTKVYLD